MPSTLPPVGEMLNLDGRTAVVTGAARGIGAASAIRLSEAGARVLISDIDEDAARRSAERLPGPHQVVGTDMYEAAAVEDLAERAVLAFGGLDVWVNNAGIYPNAPFTDLTDEEWDAVVDLNLKAVFRGAREAARTMRRIGSRGVIINIASNAGMAAGRASAHYVASKHGVVGLTKSLAVDLGAYGIRAVGIAPGVTRTEGIEEQIDALRESGWGDIEAYAERTTPLGRMAFADEIARVVLFAASDLASYVSGTTILVDGGQVVSLSAG